MAGAGNQGAGASSAGGGTPATASVPSGAFLFDPWTKASHSARKVDPHTRDYVLDKGSGRIVGVNYVRAAVQMSIHTVKRSSAIWEMGHDLPSIQRIAPNIEKQILSTLTDALGPLIRLGLVEVVGFTQFKVGDGVNGLNRGAVFGRLEWRDLTTGLEHTEVV